MSAPGAPFVDCTALLADASAAGPLTFTPLPEAGPWDALLAALPRQPVGYGWRHVAYQHAYFAEFSSRYARLDCLVGWQGKPIGLWPLALAADDAGQARLTSNLNGVAGVVPPLLPPALPEKVHKAAARQWLTLAGAISAAHGVGGLTFAAPPATGAAPPWQRILLELGATTRVRHQARIDLALPEADYHAGLRKSYKALINSARRSWSATIDEKGNDEAFAAFEAFHIQVAGRRTRSRASWTEQFAAIAEGSAFAVYLRDAAGTLVGASLFNCSRDEVLYAVGAYDRTLFDKPLAHLGLAEAIACARRRGARNFILGDRPYSADQPAPNEKELQIGYFKEGFATELVLVPYLTIDSEALKAAENR